MFTVAGDLGVNQSVTSGQTVTFVGGVGLTTTGSATRNITVDLDNTAVTAASYGTASSVGSFTVDAQGRITNASNTAIAISASAITSGTLSVTRGGTGVDGSSASNGQLLIGNGSGYSLASITAGSGISVSNGAGSITIENSGAAASCSSSSNYICNDGNSVGSARTIGTNDAQNLNFETNGSTAATISSMGETLFKDPSNSVISFQVQNSSALPYFTVDTSGGRILIGSTTPDATAIAMVLDSSTAEPAGVNGAMYYNSTSNKFRCFENSAWVNCIGSSSGSAISSNYTILSNTITYTNLPAADKEFTNTPRVQANLTNATQFRLNVNRVGGTITGTTDCRAQYATTFSGAYANLDGGTGPELDVASGASGGGYSTGWVSLVAGAKADVHIRIMCKDGNGVNDPVFKNISIEVK